MSVEICWVSASLGNISFDFLCGASFGATKNDTAVIQTENCGLEALKSCCTGKLGVPGVLGLQLHMQNSKESSPAPPTATALAARTFSAVKWGLASHVANLVFLLELVTYSRFQPQAIPTCLVFQSSHSCFNSYLSLPSSWFFSITFLR